MNKAYQRVILAVLLAAYSATAVALAGEPTDQIKQTTDKILAIVQDPALKDASKEDDRQKQMRKEIDARFDWTTMARSAYGNKWKDLSEAQRTDFTKLFSDLVNKNYMSKVESYSGEKIQYKNDRVDGKYGVVDIVIITLRNTDVPVSYRVLKKDNMWLVYDVSVEGVSMVNNYRSQIAAILNSSTYDNLMARLRAKIEAKVPEKGEKKSGDKAEPKSAGDAL